MQSDWGLPQSPNALVEHLETWVFVPGGVGWRSTRCRDPPKSHVCVCLLLQYLLQSFKSSRLRVHTNPKARTDALGESEVRHRERHSDCPSSSAYGYNSGGPLPDDLRGGPEGVGGIADCKYNATSELLKNVTPYSTQTKET